MADLGNIAALKASNLAVLNNSVPDESIDPSDHNQTMIDTIDTLTNGVVLQLPLVSGTNIKTVNSNSLLGSGDIAITPNATHTGEVTGATALTVQPIAISNKPSLASPTGTEEVLVNDAGTLKKVLISALAGGTSLGNILYVSTTGSNSETRANALGNLGKPLTPEQARSVALSGDTILVMAGSYALTLTTTNGYAKDGVNWVLMPKAIFSKTTTGAMFNTSGFSVGSNVYGDGDFYGTGSCGRIYHDEINGLDTFFCGNICENTNEACYQAIGTNTNRRIVIFKTRIISTASYAVRGISNVEVNCPIVQSTVTNAINFNTGLDCTINALKIENTSGGFAIDGDCNKLVVNAAYVDRIYANGTRAWILNVTQSLAITNAMSESSSLTFNGFVTTFTHTSGNSYVKLCNAITASGTGYMSATLNTGFTSSVTGSSTMLLDLRVVNLSTDYTVIVNCSNANAKVNFLGVWNVTLLSNFSNGRFNLLGVFKPTTYTSYSGVNYNIYQTGGTILLSGTLDFSAITATNLMGIWMDAGGSVIINGGAIIVHNQDQIGIGDTDTIRNIKVYAGGLSTNQTSFLAAKTGTLGLVNITGGTILEDADIIS